MKNEYILHNFLVCLDDILAEISWFLELTGYFKARINMFQKVLMTLDTHPSSPDSKNSKIITADGKMIVPLTSNVNFLKQLQGLKHWQKRSCFIKPMLQHRMTTVHYNIQLVIISIILIIWSCLVIINFGKEHHSDTYVISSVDDHYDERNKKLLKKVIEKLRRGKSVA